MKLKINRGSTNYIAKIYIQNINTGYPLVGLIPASSGLTWVYIRNGDSTITGPISIGTIATLGAWTANNGFREVDATNFPGLYEIHIPNAALASGTAVHMLIQGAANMLPIIIEIELDALNYQDSVRAGLTSIPNVSQGNVGALPTGDALGRVTIGDVATAAGQLIADHILVRNWTSVSLTQTGRCLLNAARFLRNKWYVDTGNVLRVTLEDDTTEAWNAQLTTTTSGNGITGSDPT